MNIFRNGNTVKIDEAELTKMLYQLMDIKVTGIGVHYEGSGDSGCVDSIHWTDDKDFDIKDPEATIDWNNPQLRDLKIPENLQQEMYKIFEDICDEEILSNVEDWYNNEGGYGWVFIEIPSGNFIVHNNVRRMETDTYFHEGKILEKV